MQIYKIYLSGFTTKYNNTNPSKQLFFFFCNQKEITEYLINHVYGR